LLSKQIRINIKYSVSTTLKHEVVNYKFTHVPVQCLPCTCLQYLEIFMCTDILQASFVFINRTKYILLGII